jgi:hypothetical protein
MRNRVIGDAKRSILAAGHPSVILPPIGKRDVLPVTHERQAILVGQPVFNLDPHHPLRRGRGGGNPGLLRHDGKTGRLRGCRQLSVGTNEDTILRLLAAPDERRRQLKRIQCPQAVSIRQAFS